MMLKFIQTKSFSSPRVCMLLPDSTIAAAPLPTAAHLNGQSLK